MWKISKASILRILLMISFCIGSLSSCGSASKISRTKVDTQKLDALVSSDRFEIRSDWAMPLATNSMNSLANAGLFPPGSSAGQINLIGNANYVRVMGDSLSVYLPYFGERQMGGGYNSDGAGIAFEGIPDTMEITKNEEKQQYDILLKMKHNLENFILTITLFPNLNSAINVSSSQRFPIRYSGSVQVLPTED